MTMSELSGLARPLDPRLPTNAAVLAVTVAVVVVGGLLAWRDGSPAPEALAVGGRIGLAVLLTWALAREFAPDESVQAFIGVGLALLLLPYLRGVDLAGMFLLLLCTRIVNGSTGRPPTWLDALLGTGLAVWQTVAGQGLYLVLLIAVAGVRAIHNWPVHRRLLAAAMIVAIAGSALLLGWADRLIVRDLLTPALAGTAAVGALVALYLALTTRSITSRADAVERPIEAADVRLALLVAAALAAALTLSGGEAGLFAALPVWLAFGGLAAGRLLGRFHRS